MGRNPSIKKMRPIAIQSEFPHSMLPNTQIIYEYSAWKSVHLIHGTI
jgi:hypothetical protein